MLSTAQGIKKAEDLVKFKYEAIEQTFQGNGIVVREVIILRKERLRGVAQWIRNKPYRADPDFTIGAAKIGAAKIGASKIGAAKPYDIELILSIAAFGKKEASNGT
jgi:hypothetical protein